MMRADAIGKSASKTLRLVLAIGIFAEVGCEGPVSEDKREDPALKASTQKSMEIYKAKTPRR